VNSGPVTNIEHGWTELDRVVIVTLLSNSKRLMEMKQIVSQVHQHANPNDTRAASWRPVTSGGRSM
jgi:hypothetical protein